MQLNAIPDRDEITKAMRSCDYSKAPDYGGFNMGFIKKFWNTIGDDIVSYIQKFFMEERCDKAINTTWVNLVPKNQNPFKIEDYWPISVVKSIYKIISKVLVNRLKSIVGLITNENKTGFVLGR